MDFSWPVIQECKDKDLKCPSWAILGQCTAGDRMIWMNRNCRESCGRCKGKSCCDNDLENLNFSCISNCGNVCTAKHKWAVR